MTRIREEEDCTLRKVTSQSYFLKLNKLSFVQIPVGMQEIFYPKMRKEFPTKNWRKQTLADFCESYKQLVRSNAQF